MAIKVIIQLLSRAFAYVCSPLNLIIVALAGTLVHSILKQRAARITAVMQNDLVVPPLLKDLTLEELRQYDGTQHGGRILIAIMGHIYDITKADRTHRPGAICLMFAGKEMTRFLARQQEAIDQRMMFDDFSDLTDKEIEMVRMMEDAVREEFPRVGEVMRINDLTIESEKVDSDDEEHSEDTVVYTHGL